MPASSADVLRGTLELLVLKTLALEPMHGWGISQRIQEGTSGVLEVNQGSLYPALQRLEVKGWVASEWRVSENNRRARYYRLTPSGRKALGQETAGWRRYVAAVDAILGRREMSLISGLRARLRSLFHAAATEADLDDEIRFHIERETEKNLRSGMSPEEALRRARLAFGSLRRMREEHRESRGNGWLEDALADARYGFRALLRNPVIATTAVLTLALGIGANTAIFSVVSAVILRPLPFPASDRLMKLSEDNAEEGWHQQVVAPANFLDWKARVHAFQDVAAYTPGGHTTLTGQGDPVMLHNANVSGSFFQVLGVPPARGRGFTEEETWRNGAHVAVISDRMWRARFGADPAAVGRIIALDGVPTEIVGVTPPGFSFPASDIDVWSPFDWDRSNRAQTWFRRAHWLDVVARLAPGATEASARAEFQTVVRRLQTEYPGTNRVMGADMVPLHDFLIGNVRTPLLVLLGAVILLLLIACANVGNLLLVQALGREREAALRLALGAGRWRLIRQALTESVVLAAIGGRPAACWAGPAPAGWPRSSPAACCRCGRCRWTGAFWDTCWASAPRADCSSAWRPRSGAAAGSRLRS